MAGNALACFGRAVRRLHQQCATLLHRGYRRLDFALAGQHAPGGSITWPAS